MHWCPEKIKSKIRFRRIRIAVDMQVVVSSSYTCGENQSTSLGDKGFISCSASFRVRKAGKTSQNLKSCCKTESYFFVIIWKNKM